ncbi:MAG: hypothetical protein JO083_09460 [Candidatus Eremiobacteraeota bacterium]|nr:hypothetical protein [Candidatus Eremiobacteraeota bacterium]
MIELPSGPVVVEERLALLEDPDLAARLLRENPALFAAEPPRTQREVLAWTTRKLGTAVLAVTAVISIVAGYAVSEMTRKHDTARMPTAHPAAATLPLRHAQTAPQRHVVARPAARVAHHPATAGHPAAIVHPIAAAPHYAIPVQHASAPVVVYHRPIAAHPGVDREALAFRAHERAQAAQAAQLKAWAAEQHAIASRAAARAAQARAAREQGAVRTEAAPQARPRTETATASAPTTRTDTGATNSPLDTAPPGGNAGTKPPPSNPNGGWSDRLPNPGTLGGVIGPVIGVPRDSCTPRGGRTGIVMQAVQQILLSQQH